MYVSIFVILLIIIPIHGFALTTYKWKDEDNTWKYSQVLPPNAVNKEYYTIQNGRVIAHKLPAKSREEILEEERKKQLLEQQARLNRILLQTYNSEADIIRRRDDMVSDINKEISLIKDNNRKNNIRVEKLLVEVKSLSDKGTSVPASITIEIMKLWEQIESNDEFIKEKEKEKEEIIEKFNTDLERYRQLTGRN